MSAFKPYQCKITAEHVAKQKKIDEGVQRCKQAGPQVSYYWTTCGSSRNRYPCQQQRVQYINNSDMGCCDGASTCMGVNCNPCGNAVTGCVAAEVGEFSNQSNCDKACNTKTFQGPNAGWACNCCQLKSPGLDVTNPKNYQAGKCTQVTAGMTAVGNIYASEKDCLAHCNAVAGKPSGGQIAGITIGAVVAVALLILLIVWLVQRARKAKRQQAASAITTFSETQQQSTLFPEPTGRENESAVTSATSF